MDCFENVMNQYDPMISAVIRKLHIYRNYDAYRQAGRIALWQAWKRYDARQGPFAPFAYRSIHGALLDELKREARYAERTAMLEQEAAEKIPCVPAAEGLPDWLEELVLTEEEQLLLSQLFIAGRSLAELAEDESISIAGIKKRRERLLRKIKRLLTAQQT